MIAVVGAGRMGSVHLRALGETRLARLTAVVEPMAEPRERVAELCGVPGFATLDQLVESGLAEGVVITAPTDLHLGLVETCLEAGLPVFCEKPCGLSADQAGRAAAAAAAAGLPLQVGYYRRFLPQLVALRQRIAAGRLGELSLVVLNQWDEHPPSGEPGFDPGTGTTSATPLAWSHAQLMRLAVSIDAGRDVETPEVVRCRYSADCS